MSEKIADSTYQVWERVADDIDVNHLERLEQCDLEHSSTVKISRFERKIKKWLIFTLPSKYKIFGDIERDIPVLLSLFTTSILLIFFSQKGYFVAF